MIITQGTFENNSPEATAAHAITARAEGGAIFMNTSSAGNSPDIILDSTDGDITSQNNTTSINGTSNDNDIHFGRLEATDNSTAAASLTIEVAANNTIPEGLITVNDLTTLKDINGSTSSLTMNSGSEFHVELSGKTRTTPNINLTGNASATFNNNNLYAHRNSSMEPESRDFQEYLIVDATTGTGAVSGTFERQNTATVTIHNVNTTRTNQIWINTTVNPLTCPDPDGCGGGTDPGDGDGTDPGNGGGTGPGNGGGTTLDVVDPRDFTTPHGDRDYSGVYDIFGDNEAFKALDIYYGDPDNWGKYNNGLAAMMETLGKALQHMNPEGSLTFAMFAQRFH